MILLSSAGIWVWERRLSLQWTNTSPIWTWTLDRSWSLYSMEPEIRLCKNNSTEMMCFTLTVMLKHVLCVCVMYRVIKKVFPCFIRAPSDSNAKPIDQLYAGNEESTLTLPVISPITHTHSVCAPQMTVIRAFCWTWRGLITPANRFRSGGLWTSRRQGRSRWDPRQSWRRRVRRDCSFTSSVIKSVLPAWASWQDTGESHDTSEPCGRGFRWQSSGWSQTA